MSATLTEGKFDYFPYAFFSAFTTLPSIQHNTDFLKDIQTIFSNYRKGLAGMQEKANGPASLDTDSSEPYLYQPVAYCLFGEFDLAIFSLIDDFSFATQNFKPSAGSPGFKYQVNTGIIPMIEAYNKKMPEFRNQTLPGFFKPGPDGIIYPFTGIASVKFNNAMLVGLGQDFLTIMNFFLITLLDQKIEAMEDDGTKLFYVINENLGWNELTIYFFGNSMSAMQKLLMDFRQVRLRDIKDHLTGLIGEPEFNGEKIRKEILPLFTKLKNSSLLSDLILKKGEHKDYLESHPVIATSITYGFRYEIISLLGHKQRLMDKCGFKDYHYTAFMQECNRKGAIATGWKIKPGHERAANKMIRACFPKETGNVFDVTQTGKYPFTFPATPISFKDYIDFAKRSQRIPAFEKFRHVIKLRSHIHWAQGNEFREFKKAQHYDPTPHQYRITEEQILKIQQQLCNYPIPYTFKSQIENLLINYNDAITDPLMNNYFIGLKYSLFSFLKDKFHLDLFDPVTPRKTKPVKPDALNSFLSITQVKQISSGEEKKLKPANTIDSLDTDSITEFIQNWNKAYWNRYFHSYYFTEINDFNIEHHGGIQQILFTYDTIYRLITRRIYGAHTRYPFVNVQVGPTITSTLFFNTINFNHLFRPAIYACECVHEAANHIIPYLVQHCNAKEYNFLYNPVRGRMDAEDEKVQNDLEARLNKKVGPRDAYETRYLDEHFGMNAIRHMVTDFATYMLGYAELYPKDKEPLWGPTHFGSIRLFYQTHWYLFLIRTDLYYRENTGKGCWFFKESDFRALFMRFNLMFYLFMDFTPAQLQAINKECPSVELKAIWESEKNRLLDLVYRLGGALKEEFEEQLSKFRGKSRLAPKPAIHRFRNTIVQKVFDLGWKDLTGPGRTKLKNNQSMMSEQEAYKKVIGFNQQLIKTFHAFFNERNKKNNIVIRRSEIVEGHRGTNIDFYAAPGNRTIFLDPKGHLFSTSPKARRLIFKKNVLYIKNMWDLSLQICRKDYD